MKLSISNIAWDEENDNQICSLMQKTGFSGLEIAPTRVLEHSPYDKLAEARKISIELQKKYNFSIPSMQSILYGKTENIFTSYEEKQHLLEYTKKAIDFANAINCKNIVFGCPKNRNIDNENQYDIAVSFFRELGEYALLNNTILSIEPNPTIYNTNFINTTDDAFKLAKDVSSKGFMVNVDLGTIIENNEDLVSVSENIKLVNHIHISEPYLEKIQHREIHHQLKELDYNKFFSIEMKNLGDINLVFDTIAYIGSVFL